MEIPLLTCRIRRVWIKESTALHTSIVFTWTVDENPDSPPPSPYFREID